MPKDIKTLDRDWYTVREAAKYLRVCVVTIQRMCRDGKLESFQRVPNGKRLIPAAAIRALTGACAHHEEP